MSGLETVAASVGTRMAPYLASRATTLFSRSRTAAFAEAMASASPTDDYAAALEPKQIKWLSNFVESAEFANFVLHAMIFHVADRPEEPQGPLREEIRQYVKLASGRAFANDERISLTDYVLALVRHAVASSGVQSGTTKPLTLDLAARTATAAVRNGEITSQLRSLAKTQKFAEQLRTQVRLTHQKLRLPNVVANIASDWAELYVIPDLAVVRTISGAHQDQYSDPDETPLRYVVTGDPGAGKSTYASKLAFDLCDPAFSDSQAPVPVLVTLRNHTSALRQNHLIEVVESVCRNPYSTTPPEGAIEWLLLNGKLVLIFDGIDELGSERNRNAFARLLENFSHAFPTCRIVVTSRSVGYDQAALDSDWFPRRQIRPFSQEKIREYVSYWVAAAHQPARYVDAFMSETRDLTDLCANPLLLSLLCVLYASEYTIPRRRPEIYARCAEILFERWDRERGLDFLPELHALTPRVVQELAWMMLYDADHSSGVSRPELIRVLTDEVLKDRFLTSEEASRAAEDFLDFCAGRAWIIVEVSDDRLEPKYGFVHRTFLEYFAAARLVRHSSTPTRLMRSIGEHLTDASWQMVAILAAQMFERQRENGVDDLIRVTITDAGKTRSLAQIRPRIRFAAELLQAIPAPNIAIERVVQRSVSQLCHDAPWHREGGPAEETAHFNTLLSVELPENVRRVSIALAQALSPRPGAAADDPELLDFIAMTLLQMAEQHDPRYVVEHTVRLIVQDSERASRLTRLWRSWSEPTPDDFAIISVDRLFTTIQFLGVIVYPRAFDLIRSVLRVNNYRADALETLAALLPVLLDSEKYFLSGPVTLRFTELLSVGFDEPWLSSMDRAARSATVLLLCRVLHRFYRTYDTYDIHRGHSLLLDIRDVAAGKCTAEEARKRAYNWDVEDAVVTLIGDWAATLE